MHRPVAPCVFTAIDAKARVMSWSTDSVETNSFNRACIITHWSAGFYC